MFEHKLKDYFFNVSQYSDDSYIHSFLYHKVTGRKGSWIYKDEGSCVVVCQHPHDPKILMVFPEIGEKKYDLTVSVLNYLYRWDYQIRLSRYTKDDYEQLQGSLARNSFNLVKALHVQDEEVMDWRYPLHIYNTEKVSLMQGRAFDPIRNKYNKVEKAGIECVPLDRKTAVKDMRSTLKYWEGSMIAEDKDTEDMSEFYLRFFDLLETYDGNYDGLLFFQGRRPVGFTVWDQINDEVANSFINLTDVSVTGLAEFQTVTLCRYLYEKNVRYLNVGGSETEGLDDFKRKFQPEKTIELLSIDVEYKSFIEDGIRMEKFI